MPYGVRTDKLDHNAENSQLVSLDFNKIWDGIIQPAIPEGYVYRRADELLQPGIIDKLYIEWLYSADVVIADLTFGNPNVYYELGIRHVFSKKGTVLIAQTGTKPPFDVRNQNVIYYNYFEAPSLPKFHTDLKTAIINTYEQNEDSPVHIFLPGLTVYRSSDRGDLLTEINTLKNENDNLKKDLMNLKLSDEEERYLEKIKATTENAKLMAYYNIVINSNFSSVMLYESLGIKLRKNSLLDEAENIFLHAIKKTGEDPELLRELGFCYRKKGPEYFSKAEEVFLKALSLNEYDPELLGMLGGMYKRTGDYSKARSFYEKANSVLKNDTYSLVNLAFLQLILGEKAESISVYQRIVDLTNQKILNNEAGYWDYLTRGQAFLITGDCLNSITSYDEAMKFNPPVEDLRSEFEQLNFLEKGSFKIDHLKKVLDRCFSQFR